MGKTVLQEFITKFRFKTDKKGLEQAKQSLVSFKQEALKIGASLVGILGGGAFFGKIAESIDQTAKLAQSLGLTVTQLQQLQFAGERAGVPISSLNVSLQQLSRVVGQASRGYGIYGQVLGYFGVQIRDAKGKVLPFFQIIKNLNRTFQGLSAQRQFDLGQSLGINAQTIELLQQSSTSFDQLLRRAKSLGTFTDRSAKVAATFEDRWTDVKTSLFDVGSTIFTFLAPALNVVLNSIAKFFSVLNNSPIGRFAVKMGGLVATILAVTASLKGLVVVFGLLKTAVTSLGISVELSFGWASAIIAGIVAITVALDDLIGYFRGENTLTGRIIKAIGSWLMHFKLVSESVHNLQMVFRIFESIVSNVFNVLIQSIDRFFKKIESFIYPKWLQNLVKEFGLLARVIGLIPKEKTIKINRLEEKRGAGGDGTIGTLQQSIGLPSDLFTRYSSNPENTFTRSAPTTTTTTNRSVNTTKNYNINVGDINVNAKTNASPQAISQIVNQNLKNQLKSSVRYFDNGISR